MIMFSEQRISALRTTVSERLSNDRFIHTLGVEKMALKLGELFIPQAVNELRCAALLHDIAKEIPMSKQKELLITLENITDNDLASPATYHAFVGPIIVMREFPEYATDNILSSILKHTTLDWPLSVFDMIIYLSDYIEEGRSHSECCSVRDYLLNKCSSVYVPESRFKILRSAVIMTLENTVRFVNKKGGTVNRRTLIALQNLNDTSNDIEN